MFKIIIWFLILIFLGSPVASFIVSMLGALFAVLVDFLEYRIADGILDWIKILGIGFLVVLWFTVAIITANTLLDPILKLLGV